MSGEGRSVGWGGVWFELERVESMRTRRTDSRRVNAWANGDRQRVRDEHGEYSTRERSRERDADGRWVLGNPTEEIDPQQLSQRRLRMRRTARQIQSQNHRDDERGVEVVAEAEGQNHNHTDDERLAEMVAQAEDILERCSSTVFVCEEVNCSICQDEFEVECEEEEEEEGQVKELACTHRFHKQCILRWLIRNPSCPLCRFSLASAARQ